MVNLSYYKRGMKKYTTLGKVLFTIPHFICFIIDSIFNIVEKLIFKGDK